MNKQICRLVVLFSLLTLLPVSALSDDAHTVEVSVSQKDTLIRLCNTYLEYPGQWQVIARLNRLSNPNRLSPGQKIIFPVTMLKGVLLEGRVTFLKGNASVKAAEGVGWRPAHQGDIVRVGNSLKTGAESSMEIAFEDGTAFLMRENTVISVKYAKKGLLHLVRLLYLEAGKVVSRIKSATGRDSRFEIETPSALAAARGTEFRVAVDEKTTTRAEMLESRIALSSMGSTVLLNKNEGSVAKFNEPPSPPKKLLMPPQPDNFHQHYEELPMAFRFAHVAGAVQYRVVMAKDREGKNTVKEALVRPGDAFEVSRVEDGTYYIIASSVDDTGLEGPLSEPHELVLHNARKKPATPVIVAPDTSARIQAMRSVIAWQQVPGASHYRMQIATDREFTNIIEDADRLSGTTCTTRILPAGMYHVRLRAEEMDGFAGEWSAEREFRLLQLPAPVIRTTESAAKGVSITWNRQEDAVDYQIQVSGNENFSGIVLDRTAQQPELVVNVPLAPGTYYTRLRGIDSERQAGSFSQAAHFSIEKPKRFHYEWIGVGAIFLLLLL